MKFQKFQTESLYLEKEFDNAELDTLFGVDNNPKLILEKYTEINEESKKYINYISKNIGQWYKK